MNDTPNEVNKLFGKKIRTRVCGICIKENALLLVRHKNIGISGFLWAPPGGGMEYEESARECLKREFLEETGLEVEVKNLLFVYEFLSPPFHAIELFFLTKDKGGTLQKGKDPEMPENAQIIDKVEFIPFEKIAQMDKASLHGIFRFVKTQEDLFTLKGFIY